MTIYNNDNQYNKENCENAQDDLQNNHHNVDQVNNDLNDQNNANEQENSKVNLDDFNEKIKSLEDKVIRLQAEIINTRARAADSILDAKVNGVIEVAKPLLDVIDNFDRAILSIDKEDKSPIAEGVRMIHKELLNILSSSKVESVNPEGEIFDPRLHQSIASIESDLPEMTVVNVLQCGYKINDKLIRPALVQISNSSKK